MQKVLFLFLASISLKADAKLLEFSTSCKDNPTIIISAVGDLLLHAPLQKKASVSGYDSLWGGLIDLFKTVDIAYANLEGPISPGTGINGSVIADSDAWDFKAYTGYPLFNYHRSLANALIKSGFDIVSTANNHALDRSASGVDKTIDALEDVGLPFTGTRKTNSPSSYATIISIKGITTAWIACTEHTNGNTDKRNQVLRCFDRNDRKYILDTIKQLKSQAEVIIVTPHFGEEYQRINNKAQEQFAHEVLEAGASAVFGAHPHVLQPIEKFVTRDGRETLIAYSLGNFVSYQSTTEKRSSLVLLVQFSKTGARTAISAMRYVPLVMENRTGTEKLEVRQLSESEKNGEFFKTITKSVPAENAIFSFPQQFECDQF